MRSVKDIKDSISNFPTGKHRNNFYNPVECDIARDHPLRLLPGNSSMVGGNCHIPNMSALFEHSGPLRELVDEIQRNGLNVIHLFSGDFNWYSQSSVSDHIFTNDYDPETPARDHSHPAVFLEDLRGRIPVGWADVVIYGAPFNQLLLKHYLSTRCGPERETEFHRINKRMGVKTGDAGLSSFCKSRLNEFLKPGTGRAVTISFKTTGFGLSLGYSVETIRTIPHPMDRDPEQFGCHDTMVTIERKIPQPQKRILLLPREFLDITYRIWAMYSSGGRTFSVDAIRRIIDRIVEGFVLKFGRPPVVVDPFSRNSDLATVSNDINDSTSAGYHMDARDFLVMIREGRCPEIPNGAVDIVLLDPPYSTTQSSLCYQRAGVSPLEGYTLNSDLYASCRKLASQILSPGGFLLTFGWNSLGSPANDLFLLETSLICHGGSHDDTIITIEQKIGHVEG